MNNTTPRFYGLSSDGRTNLWIVACPNCGFEFKPFSTMLAKAEHDCPKCSSIVFCDYNAEPPVASVLGAMEDD